MNEPPYEWRGRWIFRMKGTQAKAIRMREQPFLRPFVVDITNTFEMRVGFTLDHFGTWTFQEAVQEIDKLTTFLTEVRQELTDRIDDKQEE
jgi:hypothetical protein